MSKNSERICQILLHILNLVNPMKRFHFIYSIYLLVVPAILLIASRDSLSRQIYLLMHRIDATQENNTKIRRLIYTHALA